MRTCAECGGPSEKKYCSKLCANRFWKKSLGFKKKKCKVCGKPCSNIYCSYKCRDVEREKNYTAICQFCGKEFIFHKIHYQLRGQMKYCSPSCAVSSHRIDNSFFTHHQDIPLIYRTLGFLFACGYIYLLTDFEIEIRSTKKRLEDFNKTLGSTYQIFSAKGRGSNKDKYRLLIRSKEIVNYLTYIGFGESLEAHMFPLILPEYRLDFVKGYIDSEMCKIYNKKENDKEYKYYVIKTKSYPLARGIAEITGGELLTKHLEFWCIVKDTDGRFNI